MSDPARLERHAACLVRCYPKPWRQRYADEFIQLLVDEAVLDGHAAGSTIPRDLNVLRHGLWTRLAYCGLAGAVVAPQQRMRARLTLLAGVLGAFAMLAAGIWSQLTVGWEWSAPADALTKLGISVMSGAVLGMGGLVVVLGAVCVGPVVGQLRRGLPRGVANHLARQIHRPLPRGLPRPAGAQQWSWWLIGMLAAAVLWWGSNHFAAHWPGTGGHPWPGRGLIPASLARMAWAATLWITSYWAHPAALRSFPAGEVAWMAVSPVAWLILLVSVAALLRQVRLSGAVARCVALTAVVWLGLMTAFLAGAAMWVSSTASGPRHLFAVGTIDLGILALLAGGLTVATHLVRRVLAGAFEPVASAS